MKQIKLLNKAIELAKSLKSQDRYKLSAIVTDKKNNILSFGVNSYKKTHPTQAYYAEKVGKYNSIFLHAEIDAVSKIPYNKKPYAIYIARVGKTGEPRLAKPCKICNKAIKDSGIEKIYYTKD